MSNFEFAVGRRVVCVDDKNFLISDGDPNHVHEGRIYTIAAIWDCASYGLLFALEELPRHPREDRPLLYLSRRFRPVRDTLPDCLTKLLETPPVHETEPVL